MLAARNARNAEPDGEPVGFLAALAALEHTDGAELDPGKPRN